MRQLRLTGLGAVLVLAMAGSAQAQAQSNYIRGALDRMDALADGLQYGSNLSFDLSRVPAGRQFTRTVAPATGNPIRVTAACDTDCDRLQLRVVDYQNRPVAYEQPHTGSSTLRFHPQAGQTYRVYAQPLDCRAAYCYVFVGVWQ